MNKLHKDQIRRYRLHLGQHRYAALSIENLIRWARRFLEWLEEENLELKECTYSDLLSLVGSYRRESRSTTYINQGLWGVQRFYIFLIAEEKAEYNPAVNFRVKGGITKPSPGRIKHGADREYL